MRKHQHIGKTFECHVCGMQHHRLLGLKVHFSRMHAGICKQRLPCTECDRTFLDRLALERHIRIVCSILTSSQSLWVYFYSFLFSIELSAQRIGSSP